MSILPIDPAAAAAVAPEWRVPGIEEGTGAPAAAPLGGVAPGTGIAGTAASSGESFGDVLAQQISNLAELQTNAAEASQALANGTAPDAASVVIAVEKAQLAMQLAGQIRTRAAEAVSTIFHTQV